MNIGLAVSVYRVRVKIMIRYLFNDCNKDGNVYDKSLFYF